MIVLEKYKNYLASCMIVMLLVCFSNMLIASELPNHYPKTFIWTGTVEEISSHTIQISDREFKTINNNISFHRLNSQNSSLRELKVGMVVGCEFTNSNEIISLWEFPESLSASIGPWASGMQSLTP